MSERPPRKQKLQEELDLEARLKAQTQSVFDTGESIAPESPEEVLAKKNFLSGEEVDKLLYDVSQEPNPTLKDFEDILEKANGMDDVLSERLEKIGNAAIKTLHGPQAKAFRKYVAEKYPELLKREIVVDTPELDFLRNKKDRPVREKVKAAETQAENTPSASRTEESPDWGRVTPEIFEKFVRTGKVPEVIKLRIATKMIDHKEETSPEEIQIYSALPEEIKSLIRNEQRDSTTPAPFKEELKVATPAPGAEKHEEAPPQNLPGSPDDLAKFEAGLRSSVKEWQEKKKESAPVEDAHEMNPESGPAPLPAQMKQAIEGPVVSEEEVQAKDTLSEEQNEKLQEMWGPWRIPGESVVDWDRREGVVVDKERGNWGTMWEPMTVAEWREKLRGLVGKMKTPENVDNISESIQKETPSLEHLATQPKSSPTTEGNEHSENFSETKEDVKMSEKGERWRSYLSERSRSLQEKAKELGPWAAWAVDGAGTYIEKYNNLNWKAKLAITGALMLGTGLSAAAFPAVSTAFGVALNLQRGVAGAGAAMRKRQWLDKKIEANPEGFLAKTVGESEFIKNTFSAAIVLAYTGIGYVVVHEGVEVIKNIPIKEGLDTLAQKSGAAVHESVEYMKSLQAREWLENMLGYSPSEPTVAAPEAAIDTPAVEQAPIPESSPASDIHLRGPLNKPSGIMGVFAQEPLHTDYPPSQMDIIRNNPIDGGSVIPEHIPPPPAEVLQNQVQEQLLQKFPEEQQNIIRNYAETLRNNVDTLPEAQQQDAYQRLDQIFSGNPSEVIEKINELPVDEKTQLLMGARETDLSHFASGDHTDVTEKLHEAIKESLANGASIDDINKVDTQDLLKLTDSEMLEKLTPDSQALYEAHLQQLKDAGISTSDINHLRVADVLALNDNQLHHLTQGTAENIPQTVETVPQESPIETPAAHGDPISPPAAEAPHVDKSPVMPFERGPDGQPMTEEQFLKEHIQDPRVTGAQGYHPPPPEEKGFFERFFGGSQEAAGQLDISTLSAESHIYTDVTGEHLFAYGGNPQEKINMIADYLTKNPDKIIFSTDDSGNYRIPWYLDNGNPMPAEPVRTSNFFGFSSFMEAPKPEEFGKLVK